MRWALVIAGVVLALVAGFGAGVLWEHRTTKVCARAAGEYHHVLVQLAGGTEDLSSAARTALLDRTATARAMDVRCQSA
jgi:hypothetical protein